MNEIKFIDELNNKGIKLTEKQLEQFSLYFQTLVEYNQKVNLTNITEKEEVYLKHFYDSLSILFFFNIEKNSTLCDVGSGAGFPSIPLKIVRPDLKITIIDSLGKRINFINHIIKVLEIDEVDAIHARAEEYAKDYREKFSVVTARAVARLNILSELCLPLVQIGGHFIAMKGNCDDEIKESQKGIKTLGAELTNNYKFTLPNNGGKRNILIFTKKRKTPEKYPRNYSKIKNKPL